MSAQVGLFGIDHHAVEEGVDRRAQRGQRLQRGGVVAGLELRVGLRHDAAACAACSAFSAAPAAAARSTCGVGLVGDFFRMLPMRLLAAASAGASGSAAKARTAASRFGDLGQALRPQRQHGVDLLRAVALLAQAAGEAVVDEGVERVGRGRPAPAPNRPRSAQRATSGAQVAAAASRSISMRITPSAWRRSANGSLSPVGSWPMPNMPTSVSSLSASATTTPTWLRGSASPAKRGL